MKYEKHIYISNERGKRIFKNKIESFPGGSMVKNPPANSVETVSIPN